MSPRGTSLGSPLSRIPWKLWFHSSQTSKALGRRTCLSAPSPLLITLLCITCCPCLQTFDHHCPSPGWGLMSVTHPLHRRLLLFALSLACELKAGFLQGLPVREKSTLPPPCSGHSARAL